MAKANLESCNVYSNTATKVCPFRPLPINLAVVRTKGYARSCAWQRGGGLSILNSIDVALTNSNVHENHADDVCCLLNQHTQQ